MVPRFIRILIFSLLISFIPSFAFAQGPGGGAHPSGPPAGTIIGMPPQPNLEVPIRQIERRTWHIVGKVTDLRDDPLLGASVRVDIGHGAQFFRNLTTDARGYFRTEYDLDGQLVTQLQVKLRVEREGYLPAHEFVDFNDSTKTWEIPIALRPDSETPEELSVDALIAAVAPSSRAALATDPTLKPVRKDLQRAIELFLDAHDASGSLPNFDKVVRRLPDCADCRVLMGLALLKAGSYGDASRQFSEAAKLVSEKGTTQQKVEALLTRAALENWKGDYDVAAGDLLKARDLDSNNPLVLQELGRTLVFQHNWEAAEEYLGRAIDAGASPEARLLCARAFLEAGEPEQADAQMKKYLSGGKIAAFPVPVRTLYMEIQRRLNMRTYAQVDSVVSAPLKSLVKAFPELQGLEPAGSASDLNAILRKTGETVQSFFRNFPNTVSVEQVRQERLGRSGNTKDALDQRFQYLLLAQPEKGGMGLEELRTDEHGEQSAMGGLNSGFMLTSGFASTSLLFHPAFQSGTSFRYLGRQQVGGHTYYLVAFAQNPAKAQIYESFVVKEKDSVAVLFQGFAWIDSESYRIVRLRTDLLKPQPKLRLQQQTTEIKYAPVEFKQVAAAMWLPSEVAVTLEWRGKTYRNFHRYSDFKIFRTETKEKIHSVDQPATAPPGE